jgi:hypothetical protein
MMKGNNETNSDIHFEPRIASPEMFPVGLVLPHLNCSRDELVGSLE